MLFGFNVTSTIMTAYDAPEGKVWQTVTPRTDFLTFNAEYYEDAHKREYDGDIYWQPNVNDIVDALANRVYWDEYRQGIKEYGDVKLKEYLRIAILDVTRVEQVWETVEDKCWDLVMNGVEDDQIFVWDGTAGFDIQISLFRIDRELIKDCGDYDDYEHQIGQWVAVWQGGLGFTDSMVFKTIESAKENFGIEED